MVGRHWQWSIDCLPYLWFKKNYNHDKVISRKRIPRSNISQLSCFNTAVHYQNITCIISTPWIQAAHGYKHTFWLLILKIGTGAWYADFMKYNSAFLQTLTSHSSILCMTLQTVDIRMSLRAVSKVSLPSSAANIVQMNCATSSTKMGITEGNCICWNRYTISWDSNLIFSLPGIGWKLHPKLL